MISKTWASLYRILLSPYTQFPFFFVLVFLYILYLYQSVHFSHSVLSDSLRPHLLQHDRPTCQSSTPRAYSKHMSIGSVMPSNHLILCCPLLIPPSIFPSIRVFSSESVLHIRWSKYSSFSFSISLSKLAAKSLQSCPTLCDPIDGSPPGSPVPGILQARTLEWVAISFSNA